MPTSSGFSLITPYPAPAHLASSLHTIYRPLARSRRYSIGPSQLHRRSALSDHSPSSEDEPSLSESSAPSDEEGVDEADDFEEATPRMPGAEEPAALTPIISASTRQILTAERLEQLGMARTGSMATVRFQRRAMLADKLREVFELEGIEEVRAGMNDKPELLCVTYINLQRCLAGCFDLFVSYQNLLHRNDIESFESAPRLHVLDKRVPLLLCPHALQRGELLKRMCRILAHSVSFRRIKF